jgi:hypothetical protein
MGKQRKKEPVKATETPPQPAKRGRQLPARVTAAMWDALERCARGERRKVSPMVVILLEEALRARGVVIEPDAGEDE